MRTPDALPVFRVPRFLQGFGFSQPKALTFTFAFKFKTRTFEKRQGAAPNL